MFFIFRKKGRSIPRKRHQNDGSLVRSLSRWRSPPPPHRLARAPRARSSGCARAISCLRPTRLAQRRRGVRVARCVINNCLRDVEYAIGCWCSLTPPRTIARSPCRTKSQHTEFREAFQYFDDDHDGKISGEQAETVRARRRLLPLHRAPLIATYRSRSPPLTNEPRARFISSFKRLGSVRRWQSSRLRRFSRTARSRSLNS